MSDNRFLNEPLTKHPPLVGPFDAILHNHSAAADAERGDHPSFVVEVGHDDLESGVFDTQEILDGHFDIVKLDERRSRGGRIAGLDLLGLQTFLSFDEEHRKSLLGSHGGREIVAEGPIGDPLFGSF